MDSSESLTTAVSLARNLGNPGLGLVILAEGNVSVAIDDQTFWVKASGHEMASIDDAGFVAIRRRTIMDCLDSELDDSQVRQLLGASRADPSQTAHPSVETFMHALLLGLPGVSVIGHTHPTPMLPLLCSPMAKISADWRFFPDEVVCCGPASAYVPYVDPGLPLARAIRDSVDKFIKKRGEVPKTIWLQNHGLIALGRSPKEVMSATLMSVKAARLHHPTGGVPLTAKQIERIHTRPDEHHRQALLWKL